MNLTLKSSKCKSLSISSISSKVVNFHLSDQEIVSIIDSPEKVLGAQITFSGKQSVIFKNISDGFKWALNNIDQSLIRNDYKLKVYSHYLLPVIRFKLTVHDISQTNLKKLDSLIDGMIKKWLSMPPSGTHAIIHAKEGLNIKSISHLYKETHAIRHATSRLKADTQMIVSLDTRLEHEIKWTCKNSVTVYSESQFHQANEQQSVMQVKKTIKKNINDEFQNM